MLHVSNPDLVPISHKLPGTGKVLLKDVVGDGIIFWRKGPRIAVEEWVGSDVPVATGGVGEKRHTVPELEQTPLVGNEYSVPVGSEMQHAEQMVAYGPVAVTFLLRGSVRYRHIATEALVDVRHHLPEDASVGTCVLHLVRQDIVVYHLVDDRILNHIFRQVDKGAYRKDEIVVTPLTEEVSLAHVAHLSQKSTGLTKLEGKRLELPFET